MIKLRLSSMLLMTLVLSASVAGATGRDSVVYDGAMSDLLFGNDCTVRVASVDGLAYGTTAEILQTTTCGVTKTSVEWKRRTLKVGDQVTVDDFLYTAEGSNLAVELRDGNIVQLDPLTKLKLFGACKRNKGVGIELIYGAMKVNKPPTPPEESIGVMTSRVSVVPKGTVYSVNAGPEGSDADHVVKVYEGSVEVTALLTAQTPMVADLSAQAALLSDELQKGKITQEEFTRRMTAIASSSAQKQHSLNARQVVNAGFACAVRKDGDISKPKKFKD